MIKRVLQDKWPIEQARDGGRGHRPARAGDDRVRHRVHQLRTSSGWTRPSSARHAHALVDWIATYLEQVERYPVLPRVAPGDVPPRAAGAGPRTGRAVRRRVRGFRARPRAGADPLEPSRLLRLLRQLGQRARRAGRVAGGRAQPAGDAVEDVAGGHRARRGDARLAAPAARPAGRRSKASSTTPRRSRRCTRSPRRASAPCPACGRTALAGAGRRSASTAPSTRIRRWTRR